MSESDGSDATPLDPVELANTIRGEEWAFSHRHRDLLNDFIRTLHRRRHHPRVNPDGGPSAL